MPTPGYHDVFSNTVLMSESWMELVWWIGIEAHVEIGRVVERIERGEVRLKLARAEA